MRNPTIHINLSRLALILKDIGIKHPDTVAEQICSKAFPHSILSRYTVSGDAKVKKEVGRLLASARNNEITVSAFNRILSYVRKTAGHQYFKEIRQDDKQGYQMLKDVAALAVDFCYQCGFEDYSEGCKVYLTLGLELMGKKSNQYSLNKYKYHDAKIYAAYESLEDLSNDEDKDGTRQMCDLYMLLLAEYAGISRDDLTKPETYSCFLLARVEADKVEANYEDWLRAQFEEMQRMFDKVPEVTQLYTEKATQRYYSYIAEGSKATLEDEVITPTTRQDDDFMAKYNEKIKLKNK